MTFPKITTESWHEIHSRNEDMIHSRNYEYLKLGDFLGLGGFIGISKSDSCPVFMIMATEKLISDKDFPATQGLEYLIDGSVLEKDKLGIVLKLQNPDFNDVFVALVNDVIEKLSDQKTEDAVVNEFFTRLGLWKHFLDKGKASGLGPEMRRGLFGELLFLEKVIIPCIGPFGISNWTGPSGAMHDFEFGSFAVEVKTTASNKSQRITISNERQLDDTGYENLFLCHYSLTVRKNSKPSLVDQVALIESLINEDKNRLLDFHNYLLQVGYHKVHEEKYLKEGYHVGEYNYYRVKEGFPRIISEQIPDGVGGLRYKVDLGSCRDFKITEDICLSKIEELKLP